MVFNGRLDSVGKETNFELFTKPLRGVLGGKHFTDSSKLKSPQDSAILKVWQRVLVAILLIAAFPYTIIGGALLYFSKPKDIAKLALTPIFERAKIKLEEIRWDKPCHEDEVDSVFPSLEEPHWIAVAHNNTSSHSLVIPLEANNGTKTYLEIYKHPNENGPDAFWTCYLNKVGIVAVLPLCSVPNANVDAIQPIKDLLAGKVGTLKGIDYKLREKTLK